MTFPSTVSSPYSILTNTRRAGHLHYFQRHPAVVRSLKQNLSQMASLPYISMLMLLASTALTAQLNGKPQISKVMPLKLKDWTGNSGNIPDGKFWSMPQSPGDLNSPFIVWSTPDLRMTSTTPYLDDVTAADPSESIDIPNGKKVPGLNYAILPNNIPIPGPEITGLRSDGQKYDDGTLWIMSAFRLSETSDPNAPPDSLIGFEHNEDYWADTGAGSDCTHKSIAVRYSTDLGKSWTRSVPVLTKDKQTAACDHENRFTGTGDFCAAWNAEGKEWVIYAQEGVVVMSHSSDPLAKPGSWEKLDPVSGKTSPGFISDKEPLAHGDLKDFAGSNPSILKDLGTGLWHMVWAKWGGGIFHASSKDLKRWETPTLIVGEDAGVKGAKYPTLFGTAGDTATRNGSALLVFTSDDEGANEQRPIWEVDVDLTTPAVGKAEQAGTE